PRRRVHQTTRTASQYVMQFRSSAPARKRALVNLEIPLCDREPVMMHCHFMPAAAHPLPLVRIFEQSSNRRGDFGWLVAFHQQTGVAVPDNFGCAAAVSSDNRPAAGHCLDKRQAATLRL